MLPFPTLVQYGNTAPVNVSIKTLNVNSYVPTQDYIGLLSNSGKLFVSGRGISFFGLTNTAQWQVLRSDVQDVYFSTGYPGMLIKTYTNEYYTIGYHPFSTTLTSTTSWRDCTTEINTMLGSNTIQSVATNGNYMFIVRSDGAMYCVGMNDNGQFGLGNTTALSTLTLNKTAISSVGIAFNPDFGYNVSMHITTANVLFAAGYSVNGSISNTGNVTTWTQKNGQTTAFDFYGYTSILGLLNNTTWYTQGSGIKGAAGGTYQNVGAFQPITYGSGLNPVKRVGPKLGSSVGAILAIMSNNRLYTGGDNYNGSSGQGVSNTTSLSFTMVSTITFTPTIMVAGTGVSLIVDPSGFIYGTGNASTGCLPGLTGTVTTFTKIITPTE